MFICQDILQKGFDRLRLAKQVQLITDIVPNQPVNLLLMIKEVREIRTKKGRTDGLRGSEPIVAEKFLSRFSNSLSKIS